MENKFSYGEVIKHGWAMTKKYFVTILAIGALYLVVNGVDFVLDYFSGRSVVNTGDMTEIYPNKEEEQRFYQYLYDQGFIDENGKILDKVQALRSAADLQLGPEMEDKRREIYEFLQQHRNRLPFPRPVSMGLRIVLFLFSLVMGVGYLKMTLMLSRDQKPAVKELFTNWHLLIPYIIGGICLFVMAGLGFILLIVPGIIICLMFQMYAYLVVDKGLGPIAALKRSRVITKGSRGRLFVLGCLIILVNLGGLLCLLIGLIVTLPLSAIASARVYDLLEHAPDVSANPDAQTQGTV